MTQAERRAFWRRIAEVFAGVRESRTCGKRRGLCFEARDYCCAKIFRPEHYDMHYWPLVDGWDEDRVFAALLLGEMTEEECTVE